MGSGGHGHNDEEDGEKHIDNYYLWLAFCTVGMVSSLTMYGVALEYATSGGRKLHEISFVFVTTSIYATTAWLCREYFNETHTHISKYQMLTLSCTSIASTVSSVRSLRYVIYPVQVLFKSCKPVPVMIFGALLGKKYPLRKYVNVIIITTGVALFMGGGTSTSKKDAELGGGGFGTTIIGGALLTFSLCFDGATGAYEDKLMAVNNVEPFDLMFNIQLGKSFISFVALVVTNSLGRFGETVNEGGMMLLVLGVTGALGQVFVFVTISKFGALNSALIGLVRKILSLVLSFVLYGHTMNVFQTLGLALSITAMVANFYDKGGKRRNAETTGAPTIAGQLERDEAAGLMEPDIEDGNEKEPGETRTCKEGGRPNIYHDKLSGASGSSSSSNSVELGHGHVRSLHSSDSNSTATDQLLDFGDANTTTATDYDDDFDVHVSTERVTPVKGSAGGADSSLDSSFEVEFDRVTPVKK